MRRFYLSTVYQNYRIITWFVTGLLCGLVVNYIFTYKKIISQTFNRPVIIAFGDSLTQRGSSGWLGQLSNWYTRKADIINRGYSGYNSLWGIKIYDQVITPFKPNFLIIFFGANDAVIEGVPQYVPLLDYKLNLIHLIEKSKRLYPNIQILLITPPPIYEYDLQQANKLKGKTIVNDRTNERTLSYVSSCKEVGAKYSIPIVDAWNGLGGNHDSRAQYFEDGLHFNIKGNDKLFELVTNVISSEIPSWAPDNMPIDQATWQQMSISK
mmetsp:Transcript_17330/g.15628  ORF Transcript_17330/g.15628 Transcript_17330/m.15628 type:complete len:267 (+) Transcript_17330:3-803(+)